MKINYHIKAVTLTEILVVLAITAIVASLAFTVLNYFSSGLEGVSKNYSKSNELLKLEQQLTTDFISFNKVVFDPKNEKLAFSSPINEINYSITQTEIIRELDTLYVGEVLADFYYLGDKTQGGSLDALKLTLKQGSIEKKVFVSQTLDASRSYQIWD